MISERKEMRIKAVILNIIKPLFTENPALKEVFNDKEISHLHYEYTNQIFEALKDDLS